MTVYIELVFLENFAVDYFLLLAGAKISYVYPKHPALAAVFGALYACISPLWQGFFSEKLLVLLGMCIICFGLDIKKLLYSSVSVSCCACALYGILNLFFGHLLEGIFYTDNFIFVVSLCSFLASFAMYRLLIPLMRTKKLKSSEATLTLSDKSFSALIDSGNSLYYKSLPVILIDESMLDKNYAFKPLVIPYSTVNSQGSLLGFVPENAFVTYDGKTIEISCVVGLCNHKFSNSFDALLHPDILKECV